MKKIYLFLIFLTVSLVLIFGDNGEQEEIDYLLFLPNSGNQFVNEDQAKIQLDNMARYLRSRNLIEDQIYVYGYTADFVNEIDSATLSRERALHVIAELEKRGIAKEYFTVPVGYGSVNLWGNNIDEYTRSPNRRVRVLFKDIIITPVVVQEAEPEITVFETKEPVVTAPVIEAERDVKITDESGEKEKIIWWKLLIPLLLIPIYLLIRKKFRSKPESAKPVPKPAPVIALAELVRPEGGEPKYKRLTEKEIRDQAYFIFLERGCEHGFHDRDWLYAISRLTSMYEEQGYIVIWP